MKWGTTPEARLAAWGGAANAIWEFLQSPLYADFRAGAWHLAWTRLHCTAGDVLILLAAFWITAAAARTRGWVCMPRLWQAALFVAIGFAYTIASERFNVSIRSSWQYAPSMPKVFGIGVVPLAQWVIVPTAVLALVRVGCGGRAKQEEGAAGDEADTRGGAQASGIERSK